MAPKGTGEGNRKNSADWPSGRSCGQAGCAGNRLSCAGNRLSRAGNRLGRTADRSSRLRRLIPAVIASDVSEELYPSLLFSTLFYLSLPYRRLRRAIYWGQTGRPRRLPGTLFSLPLNRSRFLGSVRRFLRSDWLGGLARGSGVKVAVSWVLIGARGCPIHSLTAPSG
jgi:hypothetical protein